MIECYFIVLISSLLCFSVICIITDIDEDGIEATVFVISIWPAYVLFVIWFCASMFLKFIANYVRG